MLDEGVMDLHREALNSATRDMQAVLSDEYERAEDWAGSSTFAVDEVLEPGGAGGLATEDVDAREGVFRDSEL